MRIVKTAVSLLLTFGAIAFLAQSVSSVPTLTNIEFQQVNWYGHGQVLTVGNSLWGRMTYSYLPEDSTSYLNVVLASAPGSTGVWVVQNMPLFGTEGGLAVEQFEAVDINLQDAGLSEGDDWTETYYTVTVDSTVRTTMPAQDDYYSVVDSLDRFALDAEVELSFPDDLFDSTAVWAPITDSLRAPPVVLYRASDRSHPNRAKKKKGRDVQAVQEGDEKCVAGSFARSLDWLNREFKLGLKSNAQGIYDSLIVAGVSDKSVAAVGVPRATEWLKRKDKYIRKKTGNKVVTKVWDAGNFGDAGTYPNGQIGTIKGVAESGGDLFKWLAAQWKSKEDVELFYKYKEKNGKKWKGHAITLTRIYTGRVYSNVTHSYLDYRDDEKQGNDNRGDKKIERKNRIFKKGNTYYLKTRKRTTVITGAVSESCVKEKPADPVKTIGKAIDAPRAPPKIDAPRAPPNQSVVQHMVADFSFDSGGNCVTEGWSGQPLGGDPVDRSGLLPGPTAVQEDACGSNVTCVWYFYNGSTDTYACGGFPAQPVVPPPDEQGNYVYNQIVSPWIDWNPSGTIPATASTASFQFDVYRDLLLDRLVFYTWHVRSNVGGVVGPWRNMDYVYFGGDRDWFTEVVEIGALVEPGAAQVQVALGCWDMSYVWGGTLGSEDPCRSHAPLLDNVRISRSTTVGPAWSVRDIDLFQDSFPDDGTATGTVRVDAASNINAFDNPIVQSGDSAVVTVSEPNVGLGTDPGLGKAAVYLFVRSTGGQTGSDLSGDPVRWPVVGVDSTWTKLLMDTVYIDDEMEVPIPDRYCADLNDSFFAPPDRIDFYFAATDANSNSSFYCLYGRVENEADARDAPMEMQCLPTSNSDVLYVDDCSGWGAQPFFDTAFDMIGVPADRYDVRGSTSFQGNGPGGTGVKNVNQQLIPFYREIVWNSGGLSKGTISDGTHVDKSDDWGVLYDFLDQHTNPSGAGVYISGDNVAGEWSDLGGSASAFKANYMPFTLVSDDHQSPGGHGVSPLCPASTGGIFDHGGAGDDSLTAFGGCPVISRFDVIAPSGSSRLEMTYGGSGPDDPNAGAVLSNVATNGAGNPVAVVLSGFSFHRIRDDKPGSAFHGTVPDRVQHLTDILRFLGNVFDDPTSVPNDAPRYVNNLTQNYPNPFNPSTTVKYSIKERARVSLRVYNVAGQLVRTLVNEIRTPGVHAYTWDGRNNAGELVSSGVYFYRLVTKNFSQTRKMVVLK